jgi:ABC-2 type transport system ATP-binding protein
MVSSHILPEVQQLADVVGIIDKGHLVHQGSLDELLKASGGVRVRLLPDEVERARAALARLEGPDAVSDSNGPGGELEEGHAWLAIKVPTERAAEVNRALAGAGIYASGIETRSDLEAIFLSLTTGDGT